MLLFFCLGGIGWSINIVAFGGLVSVGILFKQGKLTIRWGGIGYQRMLDMEICGEGGGGQEIENDGDQAEAQNIAGVLPRRSPRLADRATQGQEA